MASGQDDDLRAEDQTGAEADLQGERRRSGCSSAAGGAVASGMEAADVLPVVSMSRAMTTDSGSFSCLANSSMMRMFAWCGMNAARSDRLTPAASSACWATFAISQTAQRKTVWPSWRSVGHGRRRRGTRPGCRSCPTASAFEPSEPQTVGPMPA